MTNSVQFVPMSAPSSELYEIVDNVGLRYVLPVYESLVVMSAQSTVSGAFCTHVIAKCRFACIRCCGERSSCLVCDTFAFDGDICGNGCHFGCNKCIPFVVLCAQAAGVIKKDRLEAAVHERVSSD